MRSLGYGGLPGARMMGDLGYHSGARLIGAVLFLLVIAAIVGLIVWLIVRKPRVAPTTAAPVAGDTALAIARERLARGEIDPEQYRAIVAALTESQVPPA